MASKLWEAFERTAHKPDAGRGPSGSPARLELRWTGAFPYTIDAIGALRDVGLSLHDAKAKIEDLMAKRLLVIDLPAVESVDDLIDRIGRTGATAKLVAPEPAT